MEEESQTRERLQEEEPPRECRICHTGEGGGRSFSHPCKCSGSIRFVHEECLSEWLSRSGGRACELCGHEFVFDYVYKKDLPEKLGILPLAIFIWRKCMKGVTFLFRAFLVASSSFLVPLACGAGTRIFIFIPGGIWGSFFLGASFLAGTAIFYILTASVWTLSKQAARARRRLKETLGSGGMTSEGEREELFFRLRAEEQEEGMSAGVEGGLEDAHGGVQIPVAFYTPLLSGRIGDTFVSLAITVIIGVALSFIYVILPLSVYYVISMGKELIFRVLEYLLEKKEPALSSWWAAHPAVRFYLLPEHGIIRLVLELSLKISLGASAIEGLLRLFARKILLGRVRALSSIRGNPALFRRITNLSDCISHSANLYKAATVLSADLSTFPLTAGLVLHYVFLSFSGHAWTSLPPAPSGLLLKVAALLVTCILGILSSVSLVWLVRTLRRSFRRGLFFMIHDMQHSPVLLQILSCSKTRIFSSVLLLTSFSFSLLLFTLSVQVLLLKGVFLRHFLLSSPSPSLLYRNFLLLLLFPYILRLFHRHSLLHVIRLHTKVLQGLLLQISRLFRINSFLFNEVDAGHYHAGNLGNIRFLPSQYDVTYRKNDVMKWMNLKVNEQELDTLLLAKQGRALSPPEASPENLTRNGKYHLIHVPPMLKRRVAAFAISAFLLVQMQISLTLLPCILVGALIKDFLPFGECGAGAPLALLLAGLGIRGLASAASLRRGPGEGGRGIRSAARQALCYVFLFFVTPLSVLLIVNGISWTIWGLRADRDNGAVRLRKLLGTPASPGTKAHLLPLTLVVSNFAAMRGSRVGATGILSIILFQGFCVLMTNFPYLVDELLFRRLFPENVRLLLRISVLALPLTCSLLLSAAAWLLRLLAAVPQRVVDELYLERKELRNYEAAA